MKKTFLLAGILLSMTSPSQAEMEVFFPNELNRYYPSQEICTGNKCVRIAKITAWGVYCIMWPDGRAMESWQDDIFSDINNPKFDDCADELKAKGIGYSNLYSYWEDVIREGVVRE